MAFTKYNTAELINNVSTIVQTFLKEANKKSINELTKEEHDKLLRKVEDQIEL